MNAIRITERDRSILALLVYPCFQIGLNAQELIFYLWASQKRQLQKTPLYSFEQSIRRRLKQLSSEGLLQHIRYCDEAKQCYYLAKNALCILNETTEAPYHMKTRMQNIGLIRHARLTAKAMVNLLIAFYYTRDEFRYELSEMRIDLPKGRFFIPDALLALYRTNQDALFYCEVDNSSESYDFFKNKIRNYLAIFQKEAANQYREYVLIIAPTLARAKGLLKSTQETLQEERATLCSCHFLFSYLSHIENRDAYSGWVTAGISRTPEGESFVKGLWDAI